MDELHNTQVASLKQFNKIKRAAINHCRPFITSQTQSQL
jgi:hypothetical protein